MRQGFQITEEMVGKFAIPYQEYDNAVPYVHIVELKDMDIFTQKQYGLITEEEYEALYIQEEIARLQQVIDWQTYNLQSDQERLAELKTRQ